MKKTFLLFVMLCVVHIGFAQVLVNASGLVTIGDIPFIFKVNNTVMAGYTGSSGDNNVSFGYGTLSNSTGTYNTAIGYYALHSNTTGRGNTANGYYALSSNTYGYENTANGYYALSSNTTGRYNTANGSYVLSSNKTGRNNTANGSYALYLNTSGSGNTANGSHTLYSNTTGNTNTANGVEALYLNTTGTGNTAIGSGALYNNTNGYENTANGAFSLSLNTTGGANTAIGARADVSANDLSNTTAIGYEAKTTASNQVRIGNSRVTSIGGYAAWTNISDGRAKKNIRADVPGLNFINNLQPVTYNLDLNAIDELLKSDDPKINHHKDSLRAARSSEEKEFEEKSRAAKQKQVQTGFVAQDVEKTAKSIGYDFSGVDVDEKGIYGLRYAEFVVPLVKAVQELSEKNVTLQEQVDEQREQIKQLVKLIGIKSIDKKAFEENSIESIPLLLQNTPNPFNQTTEIGYFIPETVGSANIYIYDVNGVQQRNISITERGNGITVLQATALQAGIYFYTLICDGKPVDTKQMILTR